MICKETIKQRKKFYGNNFKEIGELQSIFLGVDITARDVAEMMAIMKRVRINFINARLTKLEESPFLKSAFVQEEIENLKNSLQDSIVDYSNYKWIAENFEEYEAL